MGLERRLHFSVTNGKDAASIAVSTALGGLIPAPAKLFFPAALATGVYGIYTHDSDLMWEGGLGATFSFVPLVKEVRHAFNTGKNITVGGAHFARSLDDLMLRTPANSNIPVKMTANSNRMSVAHTLTETADAHGMQQLAQQIGGSRHVASKPINVTVNLSPPSVDYKNVSCFLE